MHTKQRQIRVAVTSAGSGIGQSIIDSCRRSELDLFLIGFDLNPLAFGLYDCDVRFTAPPVRDPGYIDYLLQVCREQSVDILIPALDLELLPLSEAAPRFDDAGIKVLVGPPGFIALCRDKLAWAQSFSQKTQTVLPAFDPDGAAEALDAGAATLPMIAKPLDGSASAGIRIIRTADELGELGPGMMVQPYALPRKGDANLDRLLKAVGEGQNVQLSEYSLQYVFAKSGKLVAQFGSLNRLKDGVPIEINPIEYAPLAETLEPVVNLLVEAGAQGPVNIQGRLTDEGPRFFEINARFTGITGNRSLFGFNEVAWLIRDWLDLDPPERTLRCNPRRVGIRQIGMRIVDVSALASGKNDGPDPDRAEAKTCVVAVTGATGWLGRHLVKEMANSGEFTNVQALARSEASADELRDWLDRAEADATVRVVEGRVFEFGLGEIDLLVNLASARPTDGPKAIAASLAYQMALCREAEVMGVPAIINISSRSVYANDGAHANQEDEPVEPLGSYGMMKWAVEQAVRRIGQGNPAASTTSLRLSRLYGLADGMRWTEVPHAFARKAALGETIELFGGEQGFDLLHIRDAVNAICWIADHPWPEWQETYNVAGGKVTTLREIAESANLAAREAGLPGAEIVVRPGEDNSVMRIDTSRINNAGWSPAVNVQDGLQELVASAGDSREGTG